MRKDNRKFLVSVNGRVIKEVNTPDDFDYVIKDILASGYYTIDQIQVWVKGNIRLTPKRYEVD